MRRVYGGEAEDAILHCQGLNIVGLKKGNGYMSASITVVSQYTQDGNLRIEARCETRSLFKQLPCMVSYKGVMMIRTTYNDAESRALYKQFAM